jgi:hypothetical protein
MKQLYISLVLLMCAFGLTTQAQHSVQMNCAHVQHPGQKCPGIMGLPNSVDTFVPPPAEFEANGERAVIINVNYNGFTPDAQAAFQYAVDIWSSLLTSSVPIVIEATWEDIPGNTLGFAGATGYFDNIPGEDGDVFFPSALADKLAGFDQSGGQPDIECSFDSGTDWYFGTDGNPPFNQYDFVSVVLHELGHGLGVAGSAFADNGLGFIGFFSTYSPASYDLYVSNGGGTPILNFGDGTSALADQLESNDLFWTGANAVANNAGINPRMYAPNPFEGGSSYSHLDENTYTAGNLNSLMTPSISNGEAIHDPGPIIMGLLEDIGWTTESVVCEGNEVLFSIVPDCFGTETTWQIFDVNNNVVASGGPYAEEFPTPNGLAIPNAICLEDGCYTFIISDTYGDGLAGSAYGCDIDGDYFMLDSDGSLLFEMAAANFGNQATHEFCVNNSIDNCGPLSLELSETGCFDDGQGLLPEIELTFNIDGTCNVEDICFRIDGGALECEDVLNIPEPLIVGDGESLYISGAQPNATYTFTFSTDDGTDSEEFSITTSGCATGDVLGCTDPLANNYDPNATIDNGTCVYGSCLAGAPTLTQNCFTDEFGVLIHRILVVPNIDGECTVLEACYQPLGTSNTTCFDLPANEIIIGDGEGVFIPIAEGAGTYEVFYTIEDGTSVSEIISIDCNQEVIGCANPFATNFNPGATLNDETQCIYDEFICDCAGTQHTIGVLTWLGDGFLDDGSFNWDGQPADFNCATWGFDCGDGGVSNDPNGVCLGNLPPNNGCDGNSCAPLSLDLTNEPCQDTGSGVLPVVGINFEINGSCMVEEICLQVDGGGYECTLLADIDLTAGDGDGIILTNSTAGGFYEFYFTTDDGSQSPVFSIIAEDCENEESICDCAGTQHNLGALNWLGDGYLDDGSFEWNGQPVDFNCATWGFDCGDGGVTNDPNGVCLGNLPPNNGCVNEVLGCTDPLAANFDPLATVNDGTCVYGIPGCTDPLAVNYNPAATIDDGSCEFINEGCTNASACNYDPQADVNDGSCEFESCAGCINPNACNFDQTATISDGSCEFDSCAGCTNPNACNFDPSATISDGSCEFDSCAGCLNPNACNFDPSASIDDGSCEFLTCAGCTDPNAINFDPSATIDDGSCQYDGIPGCTDNTACNYNEEATVDNGSCEFDSCAGCTDATACNYDATATIDDGSCEFLTCAGCTDATACNYDATATIDDGSCEFDSCAGCTDPEANNYDPNATIDDGSCTYDCMPLTLSYDLIGCNDGSGTFYIQMAVSDLGTGAPYAANNNTNGETVSINSTGNTLYGPFNVGEAVIITIVSESIANCFVTSPILECPNSVEENFDLSWSAYPNPADQAVSLSFGTLTEMQLDVLDISGRLIESRIIEANAGTLVLPTAEWANGVYQIRLSNEEMISSKRLVIQH